MSNFVDGMYVSKPNEGAPKWKLVTIGIHVKQFKEWLSKQEKNGDYLANRIEIKVSQKGKVYAQLSDFTANKDDYVPPESNPSDNVPF